MSYIDRQTTERIERIVAHALGRRRGESLADAARRALAEPRTAEPTLGVARIVIEARSVDRAEQWRLLGIAARQYLAATTN